MKQYIGTFEAKTHFAKLITQVITGEEIIITRRGKAVAKIVPIDKSFNSDAVKSAVLRLRNLAKEMKLGNFDWDEWKNYKDEGRS
jgi:prevent-host-death family protein